MRFLHTSDWHLGRTLAGRPRTDEFAAVLDEVVRIARDERVDCLLLSGDVYEHRISSPEADHFLFETLVRLHREGIPVVAIPGNHESPERWRALAPLLAEIGVRVVTEVRPPAEGGAVEVPSRDGEEAAIVACLPFVAERRFSSAAALFAGADRWARDYAQGMSDLIAAMGRGFRPDRVNVLMAHLFTEGALLGGGEMEITIGDTCAVAPARFPASASYIALGHVHRPQALPRSPVPARYAGSLLQLDFGEREQEKSVVIVDAAPGRPAAHTRTVALRAGRPLRDVAGTLDELQAAAASLGDAWLRVTVRSDGPIPAVADRVREILPRAVRVIPDHPHRTTTVEPAALLTTLQPREQYAAYHQKIHGTPPSAELLATFAEVHEAVLLAEDG